MLTLKIVLLFICVPTFAFALDPEVCFENQIEGGEKFEICLGKIQDLERGPYYFWTQGPDGRNRQHFEATGAKIDSSCQERGNETERCLDFVLTLQGVNSETLKRYRSSPIKLAGRIFEQPEQELVALSAAKIRGVRFSSLSSYADTHTFKMMVYRLALSR